ncbi:exosortase family protein XrtG [Limosilactobacillus agrestimuris]|uniref:exosortase family protein XrtG n=1 Tax=Limosilactobacillus agrestimuris TaxID=2941331 RepID=UPI0024083ED1|nr:exosortase family protein XrtG [Limosilactobacillus agrestimuris]
MIKFLILFVVIIWLYLLTLLKRSKLSAYYFGLGSIGLFIILASISNIYFNQVMPRVIAEILKSISYILKEFSVNISQNSILINFGSNNYAELFINYECSGTLETIAFISMLSFFPIYKDREKIVIGCLGVLWILVANIVRLLMTIAILNYFGINALFIAHSIIGRVIFYVVVILLYYQVFTRPQIIRGWSAKL